MFNWVYFLVSGSKAFKDPLQVYKTYFINESAFDSAFYTTLAIALVFCVCYYLITRRSMAFAKLGTWIGTLIVAAVLSFGASAYTVQLDSTTKGLGHTLEMQSKKYSEDDNMPAKKRKMRQEFNKGVFRCAPVNTFCWTNFAVGGLIFFVASLGCKRFGGYGRNTPW